MYVHDARCMIAFMIVWCDRLVVPPKVLHLWCAQIVLHLWEWEGEIVIVNLVCRVCEYCMHLVPLG